MLIALAAWLEGNEVAEQVEMGADAEVGFTDIDKGHDLKNRVGLQVDELNLILVEEPTE